MTSEYTPPETVHTLSAKSYKLRRDTFLFWPSGPAMLVIGLNQKITPVSSAKLHRWIRVIDPNSPELDLRPVILEKVGVFSYNTTLAGPNVSSESTFPLPPGDYGWTRDGCDDRHAYTGLPFSLVHPLASIVQYWRGIEIEIEDYKSAGLEESRRCKRAQDALKLNAFPPLFEESVFLRDTRCFITGTESSPTDLNLCVSWIIPPALADLLTHPRDPTTSEIKRLISISNAGVMRKDIMSLFHDNAFGVDVDDDYCIVVFRDLGSVTLPSKLHRARTCPGSGDEFLREHFRWCLRVHLQGGDICEDYDHGSIVCAAEELGLHGDENDIPPLDDPRWQSPLGKELLACHISSELRYSLWD